MVKSTSGNAIIIRPFSVGSAQDLPAGDAGVLCREENPQRHNGHQTFMQDGDNQTTDGFNQDWVA